MRDIIPILTSRMDLEKKFSQTLSGEFGIKITNQKMDRNYRFTNRNGSTGEYVNDTNYSNSFNYSEKVMAIYAGIEKEMGAVTLQLGLREESTTIKAAGAPGNVKLVQHYINLFPSINLEWEISDKHNMQINYNKRINRPDHYSFYPYKIYWYNVLESETGNIKLLPEYGHALELTYTFKGCVSNAIAYSRTNNYMLAYSTQNEITRELNSTNTNLTLSETYGYNFFCEVPLRNWWTLNTNISASLFSYRGKVNDIDYKATAFSYYGFLSTEFLIHKKNKFEVSAQYFGPRLGGVFNMQPRWALNFAYKRTFLKDRLEAVAGINDLFYTLIGKNHVKFQNQDWTVCETQDSRRFKISLSYRFGKIKIEKRETNSNEEEKEKLRH
jgi:hypothetical protein